MDEKKDRKLKSEWEVVQTYKGRHREFILAMRTLRAAGVTYQKIADIGGWKDRRDIYNFLKNAKGKIS